jgi:hypothetical protein
MFNFLKSLLFPLKSDFIVEGLDHERKVAILTDKQFGLRVEIPLGEKPIKEVCIVEPYAVRLIYKDGTSEKKSILE